MGVPFGLSDHPQAAVVVPACLARAKAKLGRLRRLQPTQKSRRLRIMTTGLVLAISYGAEVVGPPGAVKKKLRRWELRAHSLIPRVAAGQ